MMTGKIHGPQANGVARSRPACQNPPVRLACLEPLSSDEPESSPVRPAFPGSSLIRSACPGPFCQTSLPRASPIRPACRAQSSSTEAQNKHVIIVQNLVSPTCTGHQQPGITPSAKPHSPSNSTAPGSTTTKEIWKHQPGLCVSTTWGDAPIPVLEVMKGRGRSDKNKSQTHLRIKDQLLALAGPVEGRSLQARWAPCS